jgi:hypothetical protein
MDVDDVSAEEYDELVSELLNRASMVIVCYENLLRTQSTVDTSKSLAKAMKDLKEILPDELLEIMR